MVSSVDVEQSLVNSAVDGNVVNRSRPATTDDRQRQPGSSSSSRKISWPGEDEHISESREVKNGGNEAAGRVESVFLTEDQKVGLQLSARALKSVPDKSTFLTEEQSRLF